MVRVFIFIFIVVAYSCTTTPSTSTKTSIPINENDCKNYFACADSLKKINRTVVAEELNLFREKTIFSLKNNSTNNIEIKLKYDSLQYNVCSPHLQKKDITAYKITHNEKKIYLIIGKNYEGLGIGSNLYCWILLTPNEGFTQEIYNLAKEPKLVFYNNEIDNWSIHKLNYSPEHRNNIESEEYLLEQYDFSPINNKFIQVTKTKDITCQCSSQ